MVKINITKTLISCLISFFTIQNITAQDFLPKEAPTPNAASLGKYGDIPISYPNGNISLTIPIYTMSSRELEMPISLSYNAAGVNLNTLPSWTGENWALNAGGVITRQVNGEPDEWVCPTELAYHNQVHNYFESYNIIPNMVKTNNYQGLIDDELFAAKEEAYKFGLKRHDYQPDIFTFNVMGKSGKFYLDDDGFWRVACDENMEVIYDYIKNYQHRANDVTPIDLFKEFFFSKGPENSLFSDFNYSKEGPFSSLEQFNSTYSSGARDEYTKSNAPRGKKSINTFIANPFSAGIDLWEQFIGEANISWYDLGDRVLFLLLDNKSNSSFLYHMSPFENHPRGAKGGGWGTTNQTYIWTESIQTVNNNNKLKWMQLTQQNK